MKYVISTYKTYPYGLAGHIETVPLKKHLSYVNTAAAFDIETSSIKNAEAQIYAFMYIWQFAMHIDECIYVITGRTWEDFALFFDRLSRNMNLNDKKRLPIYVHNLPYEWQFMRNFINPISVFARRARHVIKVATDKGFEFRCSYALSNKSLAKFCDECETEHGKLSGELDYSKTRTYLTPITEREMQYCINDVVGLVECILNKMENDTMSSIPMTSTGYVRREFRSAMQSNPRNREKFLEQQLNEETYTLCKEAFRGGDTHANAFYVNEILDDVESYDKKSSYPAQMMYQKFPGKFFKASPEKYEENLNNPEIACLFRARFTGIQHKQRYAMPYIPLDKCRNAVNVVNDNGRILKAKYLEITLTDIDYTIIKETYNIKCIEIKDMYISHYEYLPKEFRSTLLKYFTQKESLKDIEDKIYEYNKSKNVINGSYGMIVTDIAQATWEWKENEWIPKAPSLKDALKKYYNNRNSFLSYQWGVWVTAWARKELRDAVIAAGKEAIYVDTDSLKLRGHKDLFDNLNKEIIKKAHEVNPPAYIILNGAEHTLGKWEREKPYKHFITLGAKRYAGYQDDNQWHTTISGVAKSKGKKFFNEQGIDKFKIGTTIVDSGKLGAVYNDTNDIYTITVDGATFTTSSNMVLLDKPFTLGISDAYSALLGDVEIYKFNDKMFDLEEEIVYNIHKGKRARK